MDLEEKAKQLAQQEKEKEHIQAKNEVLANVDTASSQPLVGRITEETAFSKKISDVNLKVVEQASAEDRKFNEDVKNELKQAVIKIAETENSRAALEKQNVQYKSELLETKQKLNQYIQKENEWENKVKQRQYHFDGLAPIFKMVGIDKPMCLPVLYFLATILIIPFLLMKFIKGTVGSLIYGAENGKDRPREVKGLCFTLLAVLCLIALFTLGYAIVDWLHPFGLLL